MSRRLAQVVGTMAAALAVLPGCQNLARTAAVAPVEAASAKPELPKLEPREPADAVKVESHAPMPAPAPPPPQASVFDPAYLVPGDAKNRLGQPGVVHLEEDAERPGVHLTGAQAAKAEPKLSAAAKALQWMHEGNPAKALEELKAYDKTTQEFLLSMLPVVLLATQKSINDLGAQDIAVMNDVFERWKQVFRDRAELVISKMCYCRGAKGFGAYDALPANHAFLAGTADRYGERVQIYVELKNFVSEPDDNGNYLTKLACVLVIEDAAGKKQGDPIVIPVSETTHVRRSRMNDLYMTLCFPVPILPPGTYRLTVQIVDATLSGHRRLKRESLPFRVTPVATP